MPVKIKLTKGYEALVDDEDFERINAYKWHVIKGSKSKRNIYAYTEFRHSGKVFYVNMATLVLGYKKGHLIDHINNNTLDNTRINLRFATQSQNSLNMRHWSKNDIGYRGVKYKYRKNKSFIAQLSVNGKHYNSPVTYNKHIAALYYNILVLKYAPVFGKLNVIPAKCLLDKHN